MKSVALLTLVFLLLLVLSSCSPQALPAAQVQFTAGGQVDGNMEGFSYADGSRQMTFPADFGAHPDYRTEWWYYTGNLQARNGRRFGFELTFFRVGLLPPAAELPADSRWYDRSLYFAHFALSDIGAQRFYAFERYARPGPGLAGAQGDPYRVWLEDWSVAADGAPGEYHLQAAQGLLAIDLTLTDEMGVILHGENGYSRKGEEATHASYYYSQPRLRAEGSIQVEGARHSVSGLAWKDHEFSTGVLDANQIGWDWFSLQFDDGAALMLFQLREKDGNISASSSGALISADALSTPIARDDFVLSVLDEWRSPHTGGVYPSGWRIRLAEQQCELEVRPWMADQEVNFPAFTYWEGAVRFEGACAGQPARGNGYVELTGYAGNLPLP